jgi:hypothetical protein
MPIKARRDKGIRATGASESEASNRVDPYSLKPVALVARTSDRLMVTILRLGGRDSRARRDPPRLCHLAQSSDRLVLSHPIGGSGSDKAVLSNPVAPEYEDCGSERAPAARAPRAARGYRLPGSRRRGRLDEATPWEGRSALGAEHLLGERIDERALERAGFRRRDFRDLHRALRPYPATYRISWRRTLCRGTSLVPIASLLSRYPSRWLPTTDRA